MKLTEDLSHLTQDEKEIIRYIFFTSNKNRSLMDDVVSGQDKVFLDETDHSGVTPLNIISFLKNKPEVKTFNSCQLNGCRFQLEYLPSSLFQKARNIYDKSYRKVVEEDWKKAGF